LNKSKSEFWLSISPPMIVCQTVNTYQLRLRGWTWKRSTRRSRKRQWARRRR
jgi:hypothetical protein